MVTETFFASLSAKDLKHRNLLSCLEIHLVPSLRETDAHHSFKYNTLTLPTSITSSACMVTPLRAHSPWLSPREAPVNCSNIVFSSSGWMVVAKITVYMREGAQTFIIWWAHKRAHGLGQEHPLPAQLAYSSRKRKISPM
jgi:hypothetical protein